MISIWTALAVIGESAMLGLALFMLRGLVRSIRHDTSLSIIFTMIALASMTCYIIIVSSVSWIITVASLPLAALTTLLLIRR